MYSTRDNYLLCFCVSYSEFGRFKRCHVICCCIDNVLIDLPIDWLVIFHRCAIHCHGHHRAIKMALILPVLCSFAVAVFGLETIGCWYFRTILHSCTTKSNYSVTHGISVNGRRMLCETTIACFYLAGQLNSLTAQVGLVGQFYQYPIRVSVLWYAEPDKSTKHLCRRYSMILTVPFELLKNTTNEFSVFSIPMNAKPRS